MDKTVSQSAPQRPSGTGSLAWIAFIAIAMIGAAVLISSAIRHRIGDDISRSSAPSMMTQPAPEPAPSPLPKPGVAPTGAKLMQQA